MTPYLITTLLLIGMSILYLKLANKYNITDKPNARSSHDTPTIRGGGILFLMALVFFFLQNDFQYPYLLAGTLLVGGVSFVDDLKPLSPLLRLPFQLIAIFFVLIQLDLLGIPWWAFAALWVLGVGFVNAYNFMDGINGITGLYSLSILAGFYFLNRQTGLVNEDLLLFLGISLGVFGFFNFRKKALFFAGDIGSISIAVVLFFLGILFAHQLEAPVILLMAVVYGTDSILTIFYRLLKKEKITTPHRYHIYQKLVDFHQISHLKVALGYAILQLLVNGLVYGSFRWEFWQQLVLLFGVVLFFVTSYVFVFFTIEKKFRTLTNHTIK
jgi:UDP-GlcNAc:undecaprenyl-phosphate GlcNAc-1-phosphate transferase